MNNETNISVKYVYFTFPYTWIRDKGIIHRGNEEHGMLMIIDEDGFPIKMYGYELIGHEKQE